MPRHDPLFRGESSFSQKTNLRDQSDATGYRINNCITNTLFNIERPGMPEMPTTDSLLADTVRYAQNSKKFLLELVPDISIDSFDGLGNITSPVLNSMFEILAQMCNSMKNNKARLLSSLIAVYDFYNKTQEFKSFKSLAIGFAHMIDSIFRLDQWAGSFDTILKTAQIYFDSISSYFLQPEGLEKSVKNFWELLDMKDSRSVLSLVWELTSLTGTCFFIKDFYSAHVGGKSITELISVVNEHLLQKHSDIRTRVKSASECIARVVDFIMLNFEHMIKGNFSEISWKLPPLLQFENEYADFMKHYSNYTSDPLYLESANLKLSDLRDLVTKLIEKADTKIALSKNSSDKSTLVRYLGTMNAAKAAIVSSMNPKNTKPQPMSVTLKGPAGCGKSSIAINIGKTMQRVAGREPNEHLIQTRGGDPKFEPALLTETEVIVFDDYANDKSEKLSTKSILDCVNVTREVIPKAGVDEKNKHKYSNVGTLFTTNEDNLGINQISTASPESILRRMGLVLHIKVKPEYCKEGTETLDRLHPHCMDELQGDIYDVAIYLPKGVKPVKEGFKELEIIWEVITGWENRCSTPLKSALLYMEDYLAKEWAVNVAQFERRNDPTFYCPQCRQENLTCLCEEKSKLTPEGVQDTLYHSYEQLHEGILGSKERICTLANNLDNSTIIFGEYLSGAYARKQLQCLSMKRGFEILQYIRNYWQWLLFQLFVLFVPSFVWWKYLFVIILFVVAISSHKAVDRIRFRRDCLFLLIVSVFCFVCPPIGALLLFANIYWIRHEQTSEDIRIRLEEEDRIRCCALRNNHCARFVAQGTLIGSSLLCCVWIVSGIAKKLFSKQPEFRRDIANDPFRAVTEKTNSDDESRYTIVAKGSNEAVTASHEQCEKHIEKKLLIVRITDEEGQETQVIGIPYGGCIGIPHHALPSSGKFDMSICADYSKRTSEYKTKGLKLEDTAQLRSEGLPIDYVLVRGANFPVQSDISRYFSRTPVPMRTPGTELVKQLDGTCEKIELRLNEKGLTDVVNYTNPKTGIVYDKYPSIMCRAQGRVSENGMCGSPILLKNSNVIAGIHIAGTKTSNWVGLRINQAMISEAYQELTKKRQFVANPTPESFHTKNNLCGLEFDDVSPDLAIDGIGATLSPLQEIGVVMKDGEVLSQRTEKHYFASKNPHLVEAFGPPQSRPPVAPNGIQQINSTLIKLNTPKFDLPADLIDEAAEDYLAHSCKSINFQHVINELKQDPNFFTVRTIEEATCGDETGIVGGIKNNSAAGLIYGGKKTKHYNMDVDGDPYAIRELLPYIRKDIVTQEIEWRNGRGTFDPFKRESKVNELLPWVKAEEKTRSFYGNDMAFFINATRGFIPIKHILRRNMELSECFVGITAQSKQWKQLLDYLSCDGKYDNFVCGDFSGYDTQLPKVLLEKAAFIIMEWARQGGMSESDLKFLRGALSSIISPTLIWQGHVLRAANGQPSGQPLTVEINSIVNSLLMRMTFKVIMREHYPHLSDASLSDFCRLATYGDDNVMGVDSSIPKFNHTEIQAVFARWGIKYTMADKDADSVPYQSVDEISFLKRSFRHHIDLNTVVAPIEEESIIKSLYYYVRPKNTPLKFPEQFSRLIDGAQREAALHGREYYEEWARKVHHVALGTKKMNLEFHVEWNDYEIEPYDQLIHDLSHTYTE